jgi:hypothetical protein
MIKFNCYPTVVDGEDYIVIEAEKDGIVRHTTMIMKTDPKELCPWLMAALTTLINSMEGT